MKQSLISALDLGSGTVKWSVFEGGSGAWKPRVLEEVNTELRQGMGPEATLKSGPLAVTLAACEDFLKRARVLGLRRLPAYGTSALRKAKNPEALLRPLKTLGIETTILGPEQEGRLNLYGLLALLPADARGADGPGGPDPARALVLDPGGDSTELCADLEGRGWREATVASLPLGSVSLQEAFGRARDNEPLPWENLEAVAAYARETVRTFEAAGPFLDAGLSPRIRMNLPLQRALERVNGLPQAAHGQGGPYTRRSLEVLVREVARLDRDGRGRLLEGEPLGKMDRTAYGMASWLGVLDGLPAERFWVEPWGIKLGAALFLNDGSSV